MRKESDAHLSSSAQMSGLTLERLPDVRNVREPPRLVADGSARPDEGVKRGWRCHLLAREAHDRHVGRHGDPRRLGALERRQREEGRAVGGPGRRPVHEAQRVVPSIEQRLVRGGRAMVSGTVMVGLCVW